MSTNSKVNNHKDFDAKVKKFVGVEMHQEFVALGIKINHIKKICLKLGSVHLRDSDKKGLPFKLFEKNFMYICKSLILELRKLHNYSKQLLRNKISEIMKKPLILN